MVGGIVIPIFSRGKSISPLVCVGRKSSRGQRGNLSRGRKGREYEKPMTAQNSLHLGIFQVLFSNPVFPIQTQNDEPVEIR